MSDDVQRVVIIQGGSNIVNSTAVGWILDGLSLKPGDEITVVKIPHQASKSNKLSKLFGYKSKKDSNYVFEASQKLIEEECAKIEIDMEMLYISILCENKKVGFRTESHGGASPKQVAVKAARNLNATWVVLDRQMKKYRKYFMDRLSCGMSRMKSNNTIAKLRGPTTLIEANMSAERSSVSQVTYDEMIPGSTEEENEPNKQGGNNSGPVFHARNNKKCPVTEMRSTSTTQSDLQNTEATTSTDSKWSSLLDETTTNTEKETTGEQSPFTISESQQQSNEQKYERRSILKYKEQKGKIKKGGNQSSDVIIISSCPICKNKRPKTWRKRDFTFTEIHTATEGFSPNNFISEGGFGSVFRGQLNGLKIAVKQHKHASSQGELEFKAEVQVLSKVRHENLVMLLGSCSEGSQRLLVYEYVCNGSLDYHLSKHTHRTLSWEKRIKIAMGAAKGLQYLHGNNIIHRDVKPNNILITCDYESLLGDFGLARTQAHLDQSLSETRVVGSLGYMAPEYAIYGKLSTKTDVYAFGLVLLQLITGLRTTDKIPGGKSLVVWARPLIKERNYPDLIDQRIVDSYDVHQLFLMVQVVEKCLRKDPLKRITMDKVVEYLEDTTEADTLFGSRDSSLAQT